MIISKLFKTKTTFSVSVKCKDCEIQSKEHDIKEYNKAKRLELERKLIEKLKQYEVF